MSKTEDYIHDTIEDVKSFCKRNQKQLIIGAATGVVVGITIGAVYLLGRSDRNVGSADILSDNKLSFLDGAYAIVFDASGNPIYSAELNTIHTME